MSDTVSRELFDQIKWERDMAVQQLKDLGFEFGEKPRTSGDLISRQDAINEATKDGAYGYISVEELARLPSAEPKKGKWIKSKTQASSWVCSNCDWEYRDCYDFKYYFCPECGADMREEKK